jgi:RNA polymerase sigma factor (sigma-70 family)
LLGQFVNLIIAQQKNHIEESQLVLRLKAQDKSALDYLYSNYAAVLYGVVSRIIKKEEISEEVLQDAFLKIWDKIDDYDASKGKLFTWMLNLTRNLAIDKMRSKEISRESKTRGIENLVSTIDNKEFTEQGVDSIGVKEILSALTDDQRFVIDHLYFKGYSQSELSDEFNIPLGTVKTRLRLAMNQLRLLTNVI